MSAEARRNVAPRRPVNPPRRHARDRVLTGVAGGLARWLHVDATLMRAAFAILTLAGGAGVVLYALAWLLLREEDASAGSPSKPQQAVALALVVLGLLLAFRSVGLWIGDALVWPVALALAGSAVILSRTGAPFGPTARADATTSDGQRAVARVAIGTLLVVAGITGFVATNADVGTASTLLVAVFVTAAGFALILGPWLWRLGRQLAEERRERIRADERAEVAAHLHDSVLQTLAMIQRAGTAREAVTLARRQERELRSWLYGSGGDADGDPDRRLKGAVEDMAGRVEERHGVPVETVVVGDMPLDDAARAVVKAAAEATLNAAQHSGADAISVYVEVEPHDIVAFVRDRGRGFDVDRIGPGGITHSIVARVERHGGRASIDASRGVGTEVSLRVPRRNVEEVAQ